MKQPKVVTKSYQEEPNDSSTNVLIDGSAFRVPGKTVTGEYFYMKVQDMDRGLRRAMQLQMFKSCSKAIWTSSDPIYFVAMVQPDVQDTLFMYDISTFECYLASYVNAKYAFRRVKFGPKLIEELRDILY